jgi:hypothetical protein
VIATHRSADAMTRYFSRVTFVAALFAAGGCGSTVVVAPPPVDGGVACRFPDGTECRQGQSCPSPDGCNTCACSGDGVLACTARACVDGGPADVPASARLCVSSAECALGEECHIVEGCATPSYCGPDARPGVHRGPDALLRLRRANLLRELDLPHADL